MLRIWRLSQLRSDPKEFTNFSKSRGYGTRAKLPNKSGLNCPPLQLRRSLASFRPRCDFSYGGCRYSRAGQSSDRTRCAHPLCNPCSVRWLARSRPDAHVAKRPWWLVARCSACKLLIFKFWGKHQRWSFILQFRRVFSALSLFFDFLFLSVYIIWFYSGRS